MSLPDGISLRDPRPIAAENPYTFELPHPEHVAAAREGDLVKAIFVDRDGGYDAERMWMRIEKRTADTFVGVLDNEPSDMVNLACGDPVTVPIDHVIGVYTGDGRELPEVEQRKTYWDRCFVDACVADGRCQADYIYREEPDMTEDGDKYPDSGWRIRGTEEAITDDEAKGDKPHYIALGAVLNVDDRWVGLIDRDYPCAFQWDEAAQQYIELER